MGKKCILVLLLAGLMAATSEASLLCTDSFEAVSSFWSPASQLTEASITNADCRSHCLDLDGVLSHDFDQVMTGRVSFWMGDAAYAGVRLTNTLTPATQPGYYKVIGRDENHLAFYFDYSGYGCALPDAVSIPPEDYGRYLPNPADFCLYDNETSAWHKFEIACARGSTEFFVDDVRIYAAPLNNGFNQISLYSQCGQSTRFDDFQCDLTPVTPVPEPSSWLLLGGGLIGLAGVARKKGRA